LIDTRADVYREMGRLDLASSDLRHILEISKVETVRARTKAKLNELTLSSSRPSSI